MIAENRPICLQVPINWQYSRLVGLMEGYWPFDTLVDYEDPEISIKVEACCADWFKEISPDKSILVKCMEPAQYYVKIENNSSYNKYCSFHKPIVGYM